jgi:hypothetical protein
VIGLVVLTADRLPAQAAVSPVTDQDDLPATGRFDEAFATFEPGTSPSPPVFAFDAFAGTPAAARVTADFGALFAPADAVLSTEFPAAALTFSFENPVFGFGVRARIGDLFGDVLDGALTLEVEGETTTFARQAGFAFAGVTSDMPFIEATVGVTGTGPFDFAVLDLDAATTVVPVPAAAPLLATALVGLAAWRHRTRARH